MRKKISISVLCEVEQRTEPRVKRVTAVRNTRLAPNRSDSQPASGITAACASV
jgi:hypothetical protein